MTNSVDVINTNLAQLTQWSDWITLSATYGAYYRLRGDGLTEVSVDYTGSISLVANGNLILSISAIAPKPSKQITSTAMARYEGNIILLVNTTGEVTLHNCNNASKTVTRVRAFTQYYAN